jgi:tetratricopeptide (TPR) repeat protein
VGPSLSPRPPPPAGPRSGIPPPPPPQSADLPDEELDFGGLSDAPPEPAEPARSGPSPSIEQILTETDVFVRYGLREKALEHLQKVFDLDPENISALEKMRDIYKAANDPSRAAEAVASIVQICGRQGKVTEGDRYRTELAELAPGHPLAAGAPEDGSAEPISIDITEDSGIFDAVEPDRPAVDVQTVAPAPMEAADLEPDPFAGALLDDVADAGGLGAVADLDGPHAAGSDPLDGLVESLENDPNAGAPSPPPPAAGAEAVRIPDSAFEVAPPPPAGASPAEWPPAPDGPEPAAPGPPDPLPSGVLLLEELEAADAWPAEFPLPPTGRFEGEGPGPTPPPARDAPAPEAGAPRPPELGAEALQPVDGADRFSAAPEPPNGGAAQAAGPEAQAAGSEAQAAGPEARAAGPEAQAAGPGAQAAEPEAQAAGSEAQAGSDPEPGEPGFDLGEELAREGFSLLSTDLDMDPLAAVDPAGSRDAATAEPKGTSSPPGGMEGSLPAGAEGGPPAAPAEDSANSANGDEDPFGAAAMRLGGSLEAMHEAPTQHLAASAGPPIEAEEHIETEGDISDELDEAEFMMEAGLEDEARELLTELRVRVPSSSRAQALWSRLEGGGLDEPTEPLSHVDGQAPRGSDPPSGGENPFARPSPVDAAGQPSGQVTADIAAHVEAMIEEGTEAPPSEHSFDQGMMYKELGRLDDAIREFRAAARSERRAIDSLEMIGHCLVDKDEPKAAIECFKLALKKGARGPAATNLKYEIGAAYERLNDLPRAKDWYQACHRDDPEHRDVEVRLESVQARGAGPPGGPRSSNKNKISYL